MLSEIKSLCSKYKIKMSKARGQNFLVNEEVIAKIMEVADLKQGDVVLEIGPGLGILTKELVKQAKKVLAVELDSKCAGIVKKRLAGASNFQVVISDVLQLSNQNLLDKLYDQKEAAAPYKLVANIPYNITAPILQKFTSEPPSPDMMVLLVQKEVAQRLAAKKGNYSVLGLAVQLYMQVSIEAFVPARDFYPEPEVSSALIKLTKHSQNLDALAKAGVTVKEFFRTIKIGFSSKRKQLQNNLANGFKLSNAAVKEILQKADLPSDIRAQDLNFSDWVSLTKELKIF